LKTEIPISEKDTDSLVTRVYAVVLGVNLPFIGVDGKDACKSIYLADGKQKAGCPLKAGQPYVYINKFEVLEVYPKVSLTSL
jgi:Niemann-Pick C2 protein